MRISTISELMSKMAELWPVTFPNAVKIAQWEPQYRATLGSLEGDDLNTAWHACMDGWIKQTAPQPADLLKAHHSRCTKSAANDSGPVNERTLAAFTAKQEKRDKLCVEDRAQLIASYRQNHQQAYEQAAAQGWLGQLEIQVQRAAHMISQRNDHRRNGIQVPAWKPEYCEEGSQRSANFIPWFSITTTEDGVDLIEIERNTARVWIEQAKIPGPPPRRAFPNKIVAEAGMRPMESTAA